MIEGKKSNWVLKLRSPGLLGLFVRLHSLAQKHIVSKRDYKIIIMIIK